MAGVSQVVLDSIALDIDPNSYSPLVGGRRRGVVLRIIDGTTVYQDRGFNESDLIINFQGQLTSIDTVKALLNVYIKQGHVFTFQDFKGNIFNVIFTPGTNSFDLTPIQGSNIGWEYSISLSIISVATWLQSGSFPLSS